MAKRSLNKRYKIISSFDYRGPEGKNKKSIRLGPGEEMPKLSITMVNRLLSLEKIAEVSAETGETITTDKVISLRDGELVKFMERSASTIVAALKSTNFSTDTLGKIYIYAEKAKLPNHIIATVDQIISSRTSS